MPSASTRHSTAHARTRTHIYLRPDTLYAFMNLWEREEKKKEGERNPALAFVVDCTRRNDLKRKQALLLSLSAGAEISLASARHPYVCIYIYSADCCYCCCKLPFFCAISLLKGLWERRAQFARARILIKRARSESRTAESWILWLWLYLYSGRLNFRRTLLPTRPRRRRFYYCGRDFWAEFSRFSCEFVWVEGLYTYMCVKRVERESG